MSTTIIAEKSYNSTIINPDSPPGDLHDAITMKTTEIQTMAYVASDESFSAWGEVIKETYLNMIARQTEELAALFDAYSQKVTYKTEPVSQIKAS